MRGGEKYTKVFLGPGKKYPLITRATSAAAAAAAACDAFAYLAEEEVWFDANEVFVEEKEQNGGREAVSYTHLTLPTKRIV